MKRRDFIRSSAIPLVASGLGSVEMLAHTDAKDFAERARDAEDNRDLVEHSRRILEQNLVKAGERLVVATSHQYDREFIRSLLLAGAEIGAVGCHIAVLPKLGEEVWFSKTCGESRGLTPWHWDLYADADMLIVASPEAGARTKPTLEYTSGLLPVMTSYEGKLGDHPYRTDFERLCREGSKTRWIKLGGLLEQQKRYFPTPERIARTLRAARVLHAADEIRVTSAAGTDFRASKGSRPAHAQYGAADLPGRWDNFGFACVLIGPEEYSAEGVVVVEPGSIMQIYPKTLATEDMRITGPMKVTFRGGYVTSIEGGKDAERFQALLASFDDKETFGTSHIGFGIHEKAGLDDPGFGHHNQAGSILFSMGANHGHGLGGEALRFSGMGLTTRKAVSHSHFAVYNQNFFCGDVQVVENGRLLVE